MGEFLKGYVLKMIGGGGGVAGYSQDGDSRGLAQACDKAMCFRSAGTAVLEAPEQKYASESRGPRRVSASPDRMLRRDLSEDFADDPHWGRRCSGGAA